MVESTSIKVSKRLVNKLIELKIHRRETYEDVIWRLIEAWERKSTKSE